MNSRLTAMLLAAILTGATAGFAAPYLVLKDGRRIEGQSISASPSGEITILEASGNKFTFKRDDIQELFVDPPPELKVAEDAMRAKNYDAALPALMAVIQKYPSLTYDTKAGTYAIQILLQQKKTEEAARLASRVIGSNASALKTDPAFQGAYWRTLLDTGKAAQLGALLEQAIQAGSREEAARAQLIRGDIRLSENKHKEAVLDYLRTVMLFEGVESVQPEALWKAASTFELIKDSARAKAFYLKLSTDHPNTSYGQQAKSKI